MSAQLTMFDLKIPLARCVVCRAQFFTLADTKTIRCKRTPINKDGIHTLGSFREYFDLVRVTPENELNPVEKEWRAVNEQQQ
jgi:hypothetical protein